MAKGNDRPALWLVGEDGSEHKHSFAEMSARSNRVANWLRTIGVKRGDRILMMLGNELALWETMLGAIKLGAVLIPATTLLTPDDLLDRFERGNVRHVVVGVANVEKFATLAGNYTRIAVGGAAPGWHSFADADAHPASFTPDGPTRADDPMLLYFTSGTTSKPKLVLHTQQSYPVGHLSTMFWIGLRPGDVHLNISSPGWAKHAWSCFFAPWNAGACIFIYNYSRFNAKALLGVLERCGVTTLCAPPTVWRMLIQEDLASYRGRLKIRELLGAGEPLNPEVIGQVKTAWEAGPTASSIRDEVVALVGWPVPNQARRYLTPSRESSRITSPSWTRARRISCTLGWRIFGVSNFHSTRRSPCLSNAARIALRSSSVTPFAIGLGANGGGVESSALRSRSTSAVAAPGDASVAPSAADPSDSSGNRSRCSTMFSSAESTVCPPQGFHALPARYLLNPISRNRCIVRDGMGLQAMGTDCVDQFLDGL